MFPNGYGMPFAVPYGGMAMGARTGGLFRGLGGLKSINWQGLLSNTSRTLGVINQAVPLVKQIGPMYNNMKSMLKVASLFKDETDTNVSSSSKKTEDKTIKVDNIKNDYINENTITNYSYSNSPNFFI